MTRRRDPTQLQPISESELQPGDVLLSHGGTSVSKKICLIDRGDFSHASLWDGHTVLEATGNGMKVREWPLDSLVGKARYVDAFRPTWDDEPLGSLGRSPDPILKVAHSYVGQRYSYGQLYVIGTLVALGRLTGHPQGQSIFRTFGGELAEALRQVKDLGSDDRPMICSHYVSRCFWEADSSDARRYGLWIPFEPNALMRDFDDEAEPSGDAALAADASAPALDEPESTSDNSELSFDEWEDYEALMEQCKLALFGGDAPDSTPLRDSARGHRGHRALGAETRIVRAGDPELPVCCVTPGDLQRSPTLRYLGTFAQ